MRVFEKEISSKLLFLPVLGILRETVWVVNVVSRSSINKKNADLVVVVVAILFLNCELNSGELVDEVVSFIYEARSEVGEG